jgi:hypothetical protein
MVNGSWIPSEEAIEQHTEKFRKDYRLELTDGEQAGRIELADYYRQKPPTKDILTSLHKDYDEVKFLFEKIRNGSADMATCAVDVEVEHGHG